MLQTRYAPSAARTEDAEMAMQCCLYKGYYLTAGSIRSDNGRYQARVAVTALAGEKTRSQRFLDLDQFATEAEPDTARLLAARVGSTRRRSSKPPNRCGVAAVLERAAAGR